MYLTYKEMFEINKVQLCIFSEFERICDKLNLNYYIIHGSLLGAIKSKGFIPYDDDIDVGMLRSDYNKLINEGNKVIESGYFVQSYITDKEYPLPFAKIRADNTAFVQPKMKKFNIHQGIYIDIFPIDYYPENKLIKAVKKIQSIIYNARISKRMTYESPIPALKRISQYIACLLCPSYEYAVCKRAELYQMVTKSKYAIIVGGKESEKEIPIEWFGSGCRHMFENINVNCPSNVEKYLSCIYGDYNNYNPAERYMKGDQVWVSAEYISTNTSYKDYGNI